MPSRGGERSVAALKAINVIPGSGAHLPPLVRWLGLAAGVLVFVGGLVGAASLGSEDYSELGDQPSSIGAFFLASLQPCEVAGRR